MSMTGTDWTLIVAVLVVGALLAIGKEFRLLIWRDENAVQVPDHAYDVSKLDLEYPHLHNNSAARCPVSMDSILDYLRCEAVDGESLVEADLEFVRTA